MNSLIKSFILSLSMATWSAHHPSDALMSKWEKLN